ncbi:diaminopimelate epimerase [Streptomyces sp. FH025]|uniref:diaminopimelate epimerase n=1 Tax=Streptomyces sp. FH025 TaxID=2815937 RepID=UPI001A9FF181|nr:diaminopimelate epimerase [Streptomyces sp. FH025]MBO1418643.1 diaminopimelate epimerase [Streptomyces sp. FH025]
MRFTKIHGAGNDFVLLTDPTRTKGINWSVRAQKLCDRRVGIGADGLVVSTRIAEDRLRVTCYNADGSEATMCGNALRCAASQAADAFGLREMTMEMAGVEHEAVVTSTNVRVTAEVGKVELRVLQAGWDGRIIWFDAAHTGTEHVVGIVPEVDSVKVDGFGRSVCHHEKWGAVGTNVNFVQSVGDQVLRLRTYERGVEAETLSCGSGAVAAAVIAVERGLVSGSRAITVQNRAGTPLVVSPHTGRPGRTFWVSGPVTKVYEGVLA